MSDLVERLRDKAARFHRMRWKTDYEDISEAADEIERLREAITVAGMALVLCDSTDPDAPVLDGKLWRKACEVIEEVTMENDD